MAEAESTTARGRLIPWSEVRERTGLSRTTVWRLQRTGAFPSPLALSPGRVGWLDTEVAAWTRARLDREPLDSDQFERRPGGRPPAWTANGRPSGRPGGRQASRARVDPALAETPAPEPAPEPVPGLAASPEPTIKGKRRSPPEAPGQLAFDF